MTDTTAPVSNPQTVPVGSGHDIKTMLISTVVVVGIYRLGHLVGTLKERAKQDRTTS